MAKDDSQNPTGVVNGEAQVSASGSSRPTATQGAWQGRPVKIILGRPASIGAPQDGSFYISNVTVLTDSNLKIYDSINGATIKAGSVININGNGLADFKLWGFLKAGHKIKELKPGAQTATSLSLKIPANWGKNLKKGSSLLLVFAKDFSAKRFALPAVFYFEASPKEEKAQREEQERQAEQASRQGLKEGLGQADKIGPTGVVLMGAKEMITGLGNALAIKKTEARESASGKADGILNLSGPENFVFKGDIGQEVDYDDDSWDMAEGQEAIAELEETEAILSSGTVQVSRPETYFATGAGTASVAASLKQDTQAGQGKKEISQSGTVQASAGSGYEAVGETRASKSGQVSQKSTISAGDTLGTRAVSGTGRTVAQGTAASGQTVSQTSQITTQGGEAVSQSAEVPGGPQSTITADGAVQVSGATGNETKEANIEGKIEAGSEITGDSPPLTRAEVSVAERAPSRPVVTDKGSAEVLKSEPVKQTGSQEISASRKVADEISAKILEDRENKQTESSRVSGPIVPPEALKKQEPEKISQIISGTTQMGAGFKLESSTRAGLPVAEKPEKDESEISRSKSGIVEAKTPSKYQKPGGFQPTPGRPSKVQGEVKGEVKSEQQLSQKIPKETAAFLAKAGDVETSVRLREGKTGAPARPIDGVKKPKIRAETRAELDTNIEQGRQGTSTKPPISRDLDGVKKSGALKKDDSLKVSGEPPPEPGFKKPGLPASSAGAEKQEEEAEKEKETPVAEKSAEREESELEDQKRQEETQRALFMQAAEEEAESVAKNKALQEELKVAEVAINKIINAGLLEAATPVWAMALPTFGLILIPGALIADVILLLKGFVLNNFIRKVAARFPVFSKIKNAPIKIKFNSAVKINILLMNLAAVLVGGSILIIFVGALWGVCNSFIASYTIKQIEGAGSICKYINTSAFGTALNSIGADGGRFRPSYTAAGSLLSTQEWTGMINLSAQKWNIDACVLRAVVQKESTGKADAIGHDSHSGSGDVFDVNKKPRYNLNWSFSHGVGLTQWTIFPESGQYRWQDSNTPSRDLYGRWYTVEDLLNPDTSLELTAHDFSEKIKANLGKSNIDTRGFIANSQYEKALWESFRQYNGGSIVNDKTINYGSSGVELYRLCKGATASGG